MVLSARLGIDRMMDFYSLLTRAPVRQIILHQWFNIHCKQLHLTLSRKSSSVIKEKFSFIYGKYQLKEWARRNYKARLIYGKIPYKQLERLEKICVWLIFSVWKSGRRWLQDVLNKEKSQKVKQKIYNILPFRKRSIVYQSRDNTMNQNTKGRVMKIQGSIASDATFPRRDERNKWVNQLDPWALGVINTGHIFFLGFSFLLLHRRQEALYSLIWIASKLLSVLLFSWQASSSTLFYLRTQHCPSGPLYTISRSK